MALRFAETVSGGAQMARAQQSSAQAVSRILVFHETGAATGTPKFLADLTSSFPKPSDIFSDLKFAASQGVAVSYVKRAEQADAPMVFANLGITLGYADRSSIEKIRKRPGVSAVFTAPRLGQIRPVRIAAAQLKSRLTWALVALSIESLWKQGLTGKDIIVGHLDTGVDAKHPALKGRIGDFGEWDLLGRKLRSASPHDSAMHGTHTAGTICGVAVNGQSVGVAPDAKLYSGLVIEGGDTTARILGGLDWLVGLGVRIVSMSLGYPGYTPVFTRLIEVLASRNILPVFAIGNEGPNTSRSPGNYPESLGVGAIDQNGHTATFSGSEHFSRKLDPDKPDCVAPGVGIISAKPGGGYQEMDGTSMATPHVAGIAALLLQAKPSATAADLQQAILQSCKPINGEPPLRYGHGVVQPDQALKLLTQTGASRVSPKGSKSPKVSKSPARKTRRRKGRKRV
jgi:subtilisin